MSYGFCRCVTALPAFADLSMDEVLVWYDGPVLFSAANAAGVVYLGMSVEVSGRVETLLYAPISPERLALVADGVLPSRDAFVEPAGPVLHVVCDHSGPGLIARVAVAALPIPEAWLPAAGATV